MTSTNSDVQEPGSFISGTGVFAESPHKPPAASKKTRRSRGSADAQPRAGASAAAGAMSAEIITINPRACRIWAANPRDSSLLSEVECEELITSIRAAGGNVEPILVRWVGGADADFEVIAGARRLYAVRELHQSGEIDVKMWARVIDCDDETALTLTYAENAGREEVSIIEQARGCRQAMQTLNVSQSRLAELIGVAKQTLSDRMKAADLDELVVDAFGDPRVIRVQHASKLYRLQQAEGGLELLRARAAEICAEQKMRRDAGEKLLSAVGVVRRLISPPTAADEKRTNGKSIEGRASHLGQVDQHTDDRLQLTIFLDAGSLDEICQFAVQAIRQARGAVPDPAEPRADDASSAEPERRQAPEAAAARKTGSSGPAPYFHAGRANGSDQGALTMHDQDQLDLFEA